ncbi:MAG: hypothetical protein ACOCYB_10205 [Alkalispirochaeta sp.]
MALAAAVVVLTGCHADLAAFRVVVDDNGREHTLAMRDESRRPHDEEAVVAGTLERRPRFRIEEIPERLEEVPILQLELELTGDVRDGGVEITGPITYSGQFSAAVEPASSMEEREQHASTPEERAGVIIRLDLSDRSSRVTGKDLRDAELVFTAGGGHSYTIEGVRLRTRASDLEVRLPGGDQGAIFDDRLPVGRDRGEWRLRDLSHLLAQPYAGVRLQYRMAEEAFDDREERPVVSVNIEGAGDERRTLRLYPRPGVREVILRPDVWDIEAAALTMSESTDGFQLLRVSGQTPSEDPTIPVPIEMSELLRYPASQWRHDDFELFTWTLYPDILWFDTRNYEIQAQLFRRLAFFVEKRGFIGRLLTDEELEGRHGWNAHNYRPEGLADFYNAVRSTDFPINEYETSLLEILLQRGIIVENEEGRFLPGRGGVLSISQDSGFDLRQLLIVHEAMHGVFYKESSFRRRAFDYWEQDLDTRERGFWREFFSWMSYSPDDRYLMVNEFQAYLLQQRERGVRWYFRSRTVDRLKNAFPQRVEQLDIFLRDYPTTFVDAGGAMNQALFEAAGMVGGDPFCLQPIQ